MGIEEIYLIYCNTKSDINEHLPIIRKYCSECKHITEFGTRYGVSAIAMLASKPNKFITYDIISRDFDKFKNMFYNLSKDNGIDFHFIEADDLKIEIEETDLLMIDTEHTYNQLYSELMKHANKVKKYIILHDTTSCAYEDLHYYNLPYKTDKTGLVTAYQDFLSSEMGKDWKVLEIYNNNNGLTILKKEN